MALRHFRRAGVCARSARAAAAGALLVRAVIGEPYACRESISSPFRFLLSSLLHHSTVSTVRSSAPLHHLYSRVEGFASQALVEVPLAQTGEGIAECELLKWFVREGDHVEEFQRLCEVQSDKATIEITSRFKGKIIKFLFVPGDIVKVGETLLKILVEDHVPLTSECSDSGTLPNSGPSESGSHKSLINNVAAGGVLSTPAVRCLAREHNIDIKAIKGTGKDGRVMKEDVLQYVASRASGDASPSQGSAEEDALLKAGDRVYAGTIADNIYEDKRIPLRGFHRSMVKSMTLAAKVPHFYYLEEINCDALIRLKVAFQKENMDPSVKHTFLPFLIKSLSMALTKFPLLNGSFIEESNEIIQKGCHNIGIAMDTPNGLVVPKIKRTQSLSIMEITKELSRLHQMASANKLTSEEITEGTITLSNFGTFGGKFGSPILNLPEVAIVAVGRIRKLPRFTDDGTVYPASIADVTIGADHRVVDGATVAKFCNEWKQLIEKPELLLLHMR